MTITDQPLTKSELRTLQFYHTLKGHIKIKRSHVIKTMGISIGLFQHEYTNYLQEYPQIKYNQKTKEFVFDP